MFDRDFSFGSLTPPSPRVFSNLLLLVCSSVSAFLVKSPIGSSAVDGAGFFVILLCSCSLFASSFAVCLALYCVWASFLAVLPTVFLRELISSTFFNLTVLDFSNSNCFSRGDLD
ncbi:hypothetical protein BJY01DRAFT_192363 [Aspergillus pseudoustus]|uniref:Transmembrane protein n=1 Tax=Aspergillus pseudoustus TaxID=1810923 RepID=A0ABR4JUC7_9EURO